MNQLAKHCMGEVNEIYERYWFKKRDMLPTESVDRFAAELKTLAKSSNFCNCRESPICDRMVLTIENEQTTKKLLLIRHLTLSKCIDICRSEEITVL